MTKSTASSCFSRPLIFMWPFPSGPVASPRLYYKKDYTQNLTSFNLKPKPLLHLLI
jgi:hypothetical protein